MNKDFVFRSIAASMTGSSISLIDPSQIEEMDSIHRDESHLESTGFSALAASVHATAGNLVPGVVIKCSGGDGLPYKIVCGNSRLVACREGKFPFLAIVVELDMDSKARQLMRLAESTAFCPLSPIELGRICIEAIANDYFKSVNELATAIGIDKGQLSKAMSLARLPGFVISSFSTLSDLQYRYSTPLSQAVQDRFESVANAARSLAKTAHPRDPKKVFQALTSSGKSSAVEPFNDGLITELKALGDVVGKVVLKEDGHVDIKLNKPLDIDLYDALCVALQTFLSSSFDPMNSNSAIDQGVRHEQ